LKRTVTQAGLGTQVTPPLVRADSVQLIEVLHPELRAKLRLDPGITIEDHRISKIAVSGRTPSPFGNAMGDHTVSWQALVDSVHASLYGLTITAAIGKLTRMHATASDWMARRNSRGMMLLFELGTDIAARRPRLEDAARHVTDAIADTQAKLAIDEAAAGRALGKAIAWHLTYLNYLPFATVRAKSERGSHGSAEGRHRKVVVDREVERRDADLAEAELRSQAKTDTETARRAEQARQEEVKRLAGLDAQAKAAGLAIALWALFDFTAALREAHVDFVFNTTAGDAVATAVTKLEVLKKALADTNTVVQGTTSGTLTETQRARLVEAHAEAARMGTGEGYGAVLRAARGIRDAAKAMLDTAVETSARTRKSRCDKAATDPALDALLRSARATVTAVKSDVGNAPDRLIQVMSSLLHKHLTTVANAYPMSVTDSKLLGSSAAESAWAQLSAAIRGYPDLGVTFDVAAELTLADLKAKFTEAFEARGDITVAAGNDWVVDAGAEPLVVTCDPTAANGSKFTVNGRADAPAGVEGMGSHSTAWVLECQALNALANDLTDETQIREAVYQATVDDLSLPVVDLDQFLPADQLEGGQVVDMFEAAAAVLRAGTAAESGRAFLWFRNLLPFATVDAGNRAGRGEDASGSKENLYDRRSLSDAADLVARELKNDHDRARLAEALKTAATQVGAAAKREESEDDDEDEGDPVWPGEVKTAAKRAIKRLNARSGKLGKWTCIANPTTGKTIADDAEAVVAAIKGTRWEEHERTWKLVHP
jgi:hypothetical protein